MSSSTCMLIPILLVAGPVKLIHDRDSSDYTSPHPQRGLCLAPERASDVASTEIVRAYKAAGSMIEPISFVVPRKVSQDLLLFSSSLS